MPLFSGSHSLGQDLSFRIDKKLDPACLPSLLYVFQQLLPPLCICAHTSDSQTRQKMSRALAILSLGIALTIAGHRLGVPTGPGGGTHRARGSNIPTPRYHRHRVTHAGSYLRTNVRFLNQLYFRQLRVSCVLM